MDIAKIIFSAAKTVKVSGILLLAICSHESGGFKHLYSPHDGKTASLGICQLKESTAKLVGFKGKATRLMEPQVNAFYAAKYLKYQLNRYKDSWMKAVAAYNAGSFHPSKKVLGCPRNLKYLKKVQKNLPDNMKYRLNCRGCSNDSF